MRDGSGDGVFLGRSQWIGVLDLVDGEYDL